VAADVDRNVFSNRAWSIEQLVVPREWQLSEQQSYPGILVSAVHRAGEGKITLGAECVEPRVTTENYGEKTRLALAGIHFTVSRLPAQGEAYVLDAVTHDKQTRLRQAVLVNDGIAYVLTIKAPSKVMPAFARVFEDVLRQMKLESSASGSTSGPTRR